jgi:hypothetical protein
MGRLRGSSHLSGRATVPRHGVCPVGPYERDLDAEPHRVRDVGELPQCEVASPGLDGCHVRGRDAKPFRDLCLGKRQGVAGVADLAPDELCVDL